MATHPSTIRNRLTNLGALVGGVATFFLIDALDELIKVGIGTALGWLVGLAVFVKVNERAQQRRAVDLAARSHSDLMDEARRLGVEGRSEMTKDELARAISAGEGADDGAAAAMKDTLDGAQKQLGKVLGGRKRPRRAR
ncbi:MAG: hypothetical protein ACRDY7_06685 [Acidimicrobiia bacterium]